MLIGSDDRAIIIKSSLIPLKNTRTSGGVTLISLKKGSTLKTCLNTFDEYYDTAKGYRKLKIPASGQLIAEKDIFKQQIKLDIE